MSYIPDTAGLTDIQPPLLRVIVRLHILASFAAGGSMGYIRVERAMSHFQVWPIQNKIVTHMVLDLLSSTSSMERMSKILRT